MVLSRWVCPVLWAWPVIIPLSVGILVQKRLSEVELHWPYFLGFGLPLSLLTSLPLFSPLATGGSLVRHKAGNIVIRYVCVV